MGPMGAGSVEMRQGRRCGWRVIRCRWLRLCYCLWGDRGLTASAPKCTWRLTRMAGPVSEPRCAILALPSTWPISTQQYVRHARALVCSDGKHALAPTKGKRGRCELAMVRLLSLYRADHKMAVVAGEDAKIQQFLLLAKGARGRGLADLIAKAIAEPGIFSFGELLDVPSVAEVRLRCDLLPVLVSEAEPQCAPAECICGWPAIPADRQG